MPNYVYRCHVDGDFPASFPLGAAPAVIECSAWDCRRRAKRVITMPYVAAAARPNDPAGDHTREADAMEKRWDRDMPAYKRLVEHDGIQPKAIDGCADLEERATERHQIEYGKLAPTTDAKVAEAKEALDSL